MLIDRLHVEVEGTGEPTVLLHGGPGLWDYLAPVAAMLPGRRVRYDQRGCGRSAGGPATIAQYAADLESVRVALGIERWHVLGHSWGAELALHYAARHPDRVTRVTYLSGVGAGDAYREPLRAESARRLGDGAARWRELGARDRTPAEEREFCILQWSSDFASDGRRHAEAMWELRPPGAAVNVAANRQLWAERTAADLLGLARGITLPVLLVHGAEDPRPPWLTDALLGALPDARRVIVDGAGHLPWYEKPHEVAAALRAGTGSPPLAR